MTSAPYTLILLRHGHSEWNAKNLFTGWVDVDLNERGVEEGRRAGELLRDSGLLPDVLYTSRLKRAIRTANLALDAIWRFPPARFPPPPSIPARARRSLGLQS